MPITKMDCRSVILASEIHVFFYVRSQVLFVKDPWLGSFSVASGLNMALKRSSLQSGGFYRSKQPFCQWSSSASHVAVSCLHLKDETISSRQLGWKMMILISMTHWLFIIGRFKYHYQPQCWHVYMITLFLFVWCGLFHDLSMIRCETAPSFGGQILSVVWGFLCRVSVSWRLSSPVSAWWSLDCW